MMRGFDQSIRAELSQDGSRVRLTTLLPPAVNTPFFDHAVSHMGSLDGLCPRVYQPEVVAEAIYLAALAGHGERPVTFTATLFSIASRLFPGEVRRAILRLGYDGQLTDQAASLARHEPTLFAASDRPSPVRGPFGRKRDPSACKFASSARWPGLPGNPTARSTAPASPHRHAGPTMLPGSAPPDGWLVVYSRSSETNPAASPRRSVRPAPAWQRRPFDQRSSARGFGTASMRSLT